jgi:ligand-binding sensor domain-containing protein
MRLQNGQVRRTLRQELHFCLLVALAPAPIFASADDSTLNQFVHTAWTAKDGVPANITDIAQSTDGSLWLGTRAGLYRFDGIRFELYEPESGPAFPFNRIVALLALPNVDLWIGFHDSAVSLLRNAWCDSNSYPPTPREKLSIHEWDDEAIPVRIRHCFEGE